MEDKQNRRRDRRRRNFDKRNRQNGHGKTPLFMRGSDEFDRIKKPEDYIILDNLKDADDLFHLLGKPETVETVFGEIKIFNTPKSSSAFHPESVETYIELTEEGKSVSYKYLKGGLKALVIQHPNDVFFRYIYIQIHLDNLMYEEAYELAQEAVEDFPKANLFKLVLWYTQVITGEEIGNPAVLQENNIHKIFPKEKSFTSEEVGTFYTLKGQIYIYDKDVDMAKQCLDILDKIEFTNAADILQKKIQISSYPEWVIKIAPFVILGIILGIIVFIIWLIVKFFSWIF